MVCIPGLPQSIIQDSKVVRSGISKQAPVAVAITSIKLGFFLKCIRLPNHNSIDKQWYVYHLQMDGSSIPSYKILNCEMVIRRGLVLLSNEQFLQVQSTKTNGQIFSTHPICSMNMFLHGNGFVQKLGFPMFSQKTKKIKSQDFKGKSVGKPSMVNSMGNPATCLLNQSIVITYVDKFRWYRRARSILDCNNSSSSGNRASCSCVDGFCSLRRHGHGKHKKQIHMWLTSKLTIWMIVKPYTYGTYGDINLTVQFVRIFRMSVFLTAAGDEPARINPQAATTCSPLSCCAMVSEAIAARQNAGNKPVSEPISMDETNADFLVRPAPPPSGLKTIPGE